MSGTIRVLALVLALVLAGCAQVAPRTSGLQDIHATYSEEFAELVVPRPQDGGVSDSAADAPAAKFPRTLAEIRRYRVQHPNVSDTPEGAHLTVLEAMIYLQSGRPAMAKLLEQDVAAARGRLRSGTGDVTRDLLFASAMPHLVAGWEQIHLAMTQRRSQMDRRVLDGAAAGICAVLTPDSSDDPRLAPGDDGGAYLATTAAIFNLWNYAVGKAQRDPGQPAGTPPYHQLPIDAFAAFGRDLLRAHLTDRERALAAGTTSLASLSGSVDGRLRYLEWLRWLDEQAGNAPAAGCATGAP